jgi:ribosome-associated protein
MREKIVIPFSELRFSYARSGGAGGQNVNKVNSKVILDWDMSSSPSLPPDVKERFCERYKSLIKENGEVQIQSDRERSQKANMDDCIRKLHELIERVATPPKPRKKTKPTRGSIRRRLETKKQHSDKKENRRKIY